MVDDAQPCSGKRALHSTKSKSSPDGKVVSAYLRVPAPSGQRFASCTFAFRTESITEGTPAATVLVSAVTRNVSGPGLGRGAYHTPFGVSLFPLGQSPTGLAVELLSVGEPREDGGIPSADAGRAKAVPFNGDLVAKRWARVSVSFPDPANPASRGALAFDGVDVASAMPAPLPLDVSLSADEELVLGAAEVEPLGTWEMFFDDLRCKLRP